MGGAVEKRLQGRHLDPHFSFCVASAPVFVTRNSIPFLPFKRTRCPESICGASRQWGGGFLPGNHVLTKDPPLAPTQKGAQVLLALPAPVPVGLHHGSCRDHRVHLSTWARLPLRKVAE